MPRREFDLKLLLHPLSQPLADRFNWDPGIEPLHGYSFAAQRESERTPKAVRSNGRL